MPNVGAGFPRPYEIVEDSKGVGYSTRTMTGTSIITTILFLVPLLFLFQFFLQKRLLKNLTQEKKEDTSLLLIQQQIDGLRDHLRQNLDGSTQLVGQQIGQLTQQISERLRDQGQLLQTTHETMGKRLDNAARVVGEVQSRLGKLEEANQRIFEVGKDIASLQEILRAPKLRGNLGELFLGDLLAQVLPRDHFEMQYGFKNGEKVDAVVKLGGNLVPIDSKFPLENFKKFIETQSEAEKKTVRKLFLSDVKKHVDAIAQKYIRPDEGTFDFALMYIPAENVYYEMVIKNEAFESDFSVVQHAMNKKVIPVSPNNFYVYLHTILLGLKGLRVEQSAKEILANLARVQGDLLRFSEDFAKVGTHLGNARSAYESADKRLGRLGEKFEDLSLPTEAVPLKQIAGGNE
jgi:DNA recombination protein RmuC